MQNQQQVRMKKQIEQDCQDYQRLNQDDVYQATVIRQKEKEVEHKKKEKYKSELKKLILEQKEQKKLD